MTTKSFHPWRVDETWLLPPSMQEFVPAGHPAHLIRDIVREDSDLGAILSAYTRTSSSEPMCPVAQSERHDGPRLIDEFVPSVAAMVNQVVIGREHPVRQPVVAHELPD